MPLSIDPNAILIEHKLHAYKPRKSFRDTDMEIQQKSSVQATLTIT